ncbi:MAG: MPN domain-containing protein [Pirellulaceae bacterium]
METAQLYVLLLSEGGLVLAALMLVWQARRQKWWGGDREVALRVTFVGEDESVVSSSSVADELAPQDENGEERQIPEDRGTRFLVDALTLRRSFEVVCPEGQTDGFREVFHYATGLRVCDDTFVISHIVPVEFTRQSVVGVLVADGSNIERLAWLDKLGLPLVCHVHSHPGFGPGATCPSGTDARFQERLERGGHVAIGVIFCRDGHCRFFAGDGRRFVVEVQGNQVEKVDDNVYRVSLADEDVSFAAAGR